MVFTKESCTNGKFNQSSLVTRLKKVVTIFLFYQAIHILITNISAVAVYYMQIHAIAIIASVVFQLQLTTKETYFNKLKYSE